MITRPLLGNNRYEWGGECFPGPLRSGGGSASVSPSLSDRFFLCKGRDDALRPCRRPMEEQHSELFAQACAGLPTLG